MLPVNGRPAVVLESANDRMRLKDKIVSNVAKAVKSIQELQIMSGSGHVTLSNYDWQCHRLCEHLDHTLLHGLRHVTHGYWKIVSDFTHRDCVKDIKHMSNVTTDLGRGRAWLFMALNEALLESYMRCYHQNESLVEEFYVKDALVRDQDRFNVLLTLAAGLENIEFQLECNMPYLDLCAYPPNLKQKMNVEATVEFDKLSICSMESIHPGSHRPLPQTVFETKDMMRSYSQDTGSVGSEEFTSSQRYSPSIDSGVHSDWNYRQRSITPIIEQSKGAGDSSLASSCSSDLEVIRMTKKGKPHNSKKKKRKFVSVSSLTDGEETLEASGHGAVDKIKIPPIDDIKLTSAIFKSKAEESDGAMCQSDETLSSLKRSPGDGIDDGVKVDNNTGSCAISMSSSEQLDGLDSGLGTKISTQPNGVVNKTNKVTEKSSNVSEQRRHGTGTGNKLTGNKVSNSRPDSGVFTEMLRARVDDIVNADVGQFTRELSDNVDEIDNGSINDEIDGNDTVQYKNMLRDVKSKAIYNMDDDIRDNPPDTANNSSNKVTEASAMEEETTPEEPSIYSKARDTDSFDSDEEDNDFYVTANSSKFSQHSSRSTPSRQSNSSTPSRGSNNNTPARLTPIDSKHTGSYSPITFKENNKKLGSDFNLANQNLYDLNSTNQDSDLSSDHDHLSNRNTPDIFSTNQKRPVSAASRSSQYDTEEESRLHTSRPQSSQSDYRGSPNISVASQSSNHSNQSVDPEVQGTEQQALQAKVDELIDQKKLYTRITFSEDEEDEATKTSLLVRPRTSSLRAGEVELDNNSMLYLSLDIVQEDTETVIKMFCSRQGHTEGKTKTVFVMVTTHALYILQEQGKRRFQTLNHIPYLELDFVSLGYSSQTLHIACKNKRHQYWLTTGDERVTLAMVDCLANSMENSELKPGQLEVDTESLAQKISLTKYITKECRCDPEESEVMCYSLVHWEDPTSNTVSCESDREGALYYKTLEMIIIFIIYLSFKPNESEVMCYSLVHWEDPTSNTVSCESDREGALYYKTLETTNILGTQTWKLGYAILRDGMLCLYSDKNDSKPSQFLSINEGQCVGCKRDFNSDKNHAIKIILSDETSWCISLDSEEEANRWLQGLCQAVSEGLQMNPSRSSVIPCCMILSRHKLLMCHEDLETNFVRTLGSACVPDITAVLTDEVNHTFLILAFDSTEENVCNEKWVLYFNSDLECARFKTALSSCWQKEYQVQVPEMSIEDFTLEKKSRNMATYLKSTITLN